MRKNTTKSFFKKIKKTKGCWWWMGAKTISGYGAFILNNKQYRSHRFLWQIYNGKIPKEMCICHSCDNPLCVNLKHLWLGTPCDNNKDRAKKNRGANGVKTNTSKLNEKQVKEIRKIYKRGRTSTNTLKLSKRFGITNSNIGNIIRRKTWTHI